MTEPARALPTDEFLIEHGLRLWRWRCQYAFNIGRSCTGDNDLFGIDRAGRLGERHAGKKDRRSRDACKKLMTHDFLNP